MRAIAGTVAVIEPVCSMPLHHAENPDQPKNFLKLWAAQAISAFGSRITRTALPIVAIVTLEATPTAIAVLGALAVAPGVLVGLFLGGYIDRSAKRPVLIAADAIRAAVLLAVPFAAWMQWLSIEHLWLVAALVGAATATFQIADNAFLPVLVGKDRLVDANSKLESTEAIAEIGGPSAAGLLIGLLTAPIAILFDAISYIVSAGFLLSIRASEPVSAPDIEEPTIWNDLRIGIRAGYGNRYLRPLFVAEAVWALFTGFFLALYMIFTIDTLGLSPELVGILIGAGGAGALAGAVLAQRAARRLGLGRAIVLLLAAGQAAALCIPLAQGPHWLVVGLLLVHQLAGDGLMVAYFIHSVSLRQRLLPVNVQARASATLHIQNGILLPLGAVIAGPLAQWLDVRTAVWIGVLGGLSAPLVVALSPVRGLATMPEED